MDTFKLIIELIEALSKFAWPGVALISILIFRRSISSSILRRLKKGKAKIGDNELEIELEAEQLYEYVLESGQKIDGFPVLGPSSENEQLALEASQIHTDVDKILGTAKTNPKLAIMQLSALLEKELKTIVALLGLPGPQKHANESPVEMTPIRLCEMLVGHHFLLPSTTHSLKKFWQLYNRILHGREHIHDDTLLGVLDSGLVLLKRIRTIPHETHVVYIPSIDLFSDEQCTTLRKGVKGIILESTTVGETRTYRRIFPTTQWQYYKKGKQVTWEWSLANSWGQTWYVAPDTTEKTLAWSSAGEFVGRHTEELRI